MSEGVRALAHVSLSVTNFERGVAWYERYWALTGSGGARQVAG